MNTEFRPKAYVKEKCPFSFKFLVFAAESGLLDRIDVVRLDPSDPGYEATRNMLSEKLGKAATFPVVEVELGQYMADSDRLIERYAAEAHLEAGTMPVLSFYKETIFPQLIELFQIKHPKTATGGTQGAGTS
ncbi:MAG: glutathione S-transferase N-terminal domain-containing protein [Gammaproteobacteria bacterium]